MLAAFVGFASPKTCRRAGKAADGWAILRLSAVSSQQNRSWRGGRPRPRDGAKFWSGVY